MLLVVVSSWAAVRVLLHCRYYWKLASNAHVLVHSWKHRNRKFLEYVYVRYIYVSYVFLLIWSSNCIISISRSWNFSIGLGDNKIGYWIPSTWYMHTPNGSNEARHRVPLIVTRQWPRPMSDLSSMQVCTIHQVSKSVLYTVLCSLLFDWYLDPENCWAT